jgi:hypothetical protein
MKIPDLAERFGLTGSGSASLVTVKFVAPIGREEKKRRHCR